MVLALTLKSTTHLNLIFCIQYGIKVNVDLFFEHMTKILNLIFPPSPFLHQDFCIWLFYLESCSSGRLSSFFKFQLNTTSSKKAFMITLSNVPLLVYSLTNPALLPLQSLSAFIMICNSIQKLYFFYDSCMYSSCLALCLAYRKHLINI